MLRLIFVVSLLCCSSATWSQNPSQKDVDITAPDGIKLRATFFAAGKPGPGVLLLHMCNTTRKSWEPVAKQLSERGINALTIDNRGFGESGGPRFDLSKPDVIKQLNEKWPGDFALFCEKCLPASARGQLRSGRAERAVDFLKLLDDPPERRSSHR